ncbi:MAG: leucine-rich repeat domain-containing protein, partial [Tannerellaceae bacterium]|nr:leucine-rich repeat domain-containing protein [Tannerellaceae bacterium]
MTPFHSPISDQSGTAGDLTWRLSGGALTISGTGAMPYYNGFDDPPTPWHFYRNSITAVVIEEGVTSIGSYAFISCYNLTSATIPRSVTRIGEFVFSNCRNLTDVTVEWA